MIDKENMNNRINPTDAQAAILKLKAETDTAILAHSYQAKEITEIADIVGDSYLLSVKAKECGAKNLLVCGVHFMAETAKMLSPDKHVYLANPMAGCPMAEQIKPEEILAMKAEEPDRSVVAYINTTAALKAVCDVCVTSSSAVKIVDSMEAEKILFIPDCNLGGFVADKLPRKDIKLIKGGCPVHSAVTLEDLLEAKKLHPDALVLVHPECIPEMTSRADYVGSTSGIMDFALKSDRREFIIGTEMSIAEHLQYMDTTKRFYLLSKKIICPDMKLTTLMDVYRALSDLESAYEIMMTDKEIAVSRRCIDEMIRLGG